MDKKTQDALRAVIDYVYGDEQKDFESQTDDEQEAGQNHIFNDIQLVNNWLKEQE